MLKGFEDITHELRPYELETVLPIVVAKLCHHKGKSNAVNNEELCNYVFDRTNKKLPEPRLRKIVEYIRQTKVLECLVAGRFGYFIAEKPEEIKEWLDVMRQRRNALNASIIAGESSYKKMTGVKQPNQHTKGKVKADKTAQHQFLFQQV